MPLEAVACTGCGSADVSEYKPGSYVCQHCDTTFKYVDPSPRVSATPTFCGCGAPVAFRCQICGSTMMCRACDAAGYATSHKYVTTVGFGYGALHVSSTPPLRHVCTHELWVVIGERHGSLEHACWSCVLGFLPAFADRLASGTICAAFLCNGEPKARCRCCGAAFCSECMAPTSSAALARLSAGARAGRATDYYIRAEGPLCVPCTMRRTQSLERIVAEAYPDLISGTNANDARTEIGAAWVLPSTKRRRGQRAADTEACATAKRYADDLTNRARSDEADSTCRCLEELGSSYLMFDERATTAASVAENWSWKS
jgi:hypothetical protein